MNKKRFLASMLALVLCLTSCQTPATETDQLANKFADAFGRTPTNELKRTNYCPGIGGSRTCWVTIYFTTPKTGADLESVAIAQGLSGKGGDTTELSNLLGNLQCLQWRLTINGKCLKERPATDLLKAVFKYSWHENIGGHLVSVEIYEVSHAEDVYALDSKPMTENIVEVRVSDKMSN